jgi:putative DNA primase/helicase
MDASANSNTVPVQFIEMMFGSEHSVYVCSLPNERGDESEPPERHVSTREPSHIAQFIEKWDRPKRGLFFCTGIVKKNARRAKENIVQTVFLHADIDFKNVDGDPDCTKVLRPLTRLKYQPSIIVVSGHGLHLYWLFKEAVNTQENLKRIEAALRQLSDLVGGDSQVCEVSRLMRLPGTHNTKDNGWVEVEIIEQNDRRFELSDLEEWLSETSPVILRKNRPQAVTAGECNSFTFCGESQNFKPPVDVKARLDQMMFMSGGDAGVHQTQLSTTASMLSSGVPIEEVVKIVLAATRAAAGHYGERWNWKREERAIRGMCESWIEKKLKPEKKNVPPSSVLASAAAHELAEIKVIPGQIARAIDQAEAELLKSGYPTMQRGGSLVHPVKNELAAADNTRTEVVALRPLRKEQMIYLLNKHAAVFKKYNERKKQFLPIDPPPEVALGLLQKDQWKFPDVSGVTTTPTMRPDGTIFDQAGYDPTTQLLYAPDRHLAVPLINSNPTRADAVEALQRLDALLDGFPFVSDIDRAVALAGLMTPVLRGAFNVAPMTLLCAPTAGTGKSHYVNTASTIATGRACPVITNVASSEEMEKRLGAMVLEGVPIINLDNCTHDLGGDLLCQITEQRYVRIRILGKSETPQCEYRGSVYATGNNVTYVGDMTRRGLICNLDAVLERPETRTFAFDPVKRAAEQRGQFIHHILTISRAYRVAAAKVGCSPIGSYGAWSAAVREPLVWLGKADPVASMDTLRDEDPARSAARRLMAWDRNLILLKSFTVAQLIQYADRMEAVGSGYSQTYEYAFPELRELLIQQAGNFKGVIDSRRLSRWLSSIKGQIHDGFRLVLVKESTGHGNRYGIEAVGRAERQDGAPF